MDDVVAQMNKLTKIDKLTKIVIIIYKIVENF